MTVKAVAVTMTATVRPWRRRTAGGSGSSEPQAGSCQRATDRAVALDSDD